MIMLPKIRKKKKTEIIVGLSTSRLRSETKNSIESVGVPGKPRLSDGHIRLHYRRDCRCVNCLASAYVV